MRDRHPELTELRTGFAGGAYWRGRREAFEIGELVTTEDGNRWNDPGDPTAYLTGDPGLALIEAGRHSPGQAGGDGVGVIWALDVEVEDILDLRRRDVLEMLGLEEPYWFLKRAACQALARGLRDGGACTGILAPSAGLPDIRDRYNLVLFVDRLSRPLSEVVRHPRKVGSFRLDAAGGVGTGAHHRGRRQGHVVAQGPARASSCLSNIT